MRYRWIRLLMMGLLGVMLPGVMLPAGHGAAATRPGSGAAVKAGRDFEIRPPADPGARRRWALARMDDMTRERLRCRDRFKAPRQVEDCQAQYARRYRQYNEIYIEASRD